MLEFNCSPVVGLALGATLTGAFGSILGASTAAYLGAETGEMVGAAAVSFFAGAGMVIIEDEATGRYNEILSHIK